MIVPNVFGAYDTRELPNLRIGSGATMADVVAQIKKFSEYFDKAAKLYQGALCSEPDSIATGSFGFAVGGGEMQPYTEYGNTESTRVDGYEWGYGVPIRRWRDRQMYTPEYLKIVNLQTLNNDVVASKVRYYTTRMKMILRALLNNTNYVWVDREFPGEAKGAQINVTRLLNADGSAGKILVNNAPVDVGNINHYLVSGANGITLANFTVGRGAMKDLGLTGRVIHYISSADADTVKALPSFIPRTTTTQGYVDDPDSVNNPSAVVTKPDSIGVIANGGTADGEVIVFPFFPAGYTFTNDATAEPPLALREHADAEFQGHRLIQDETRNDYGDDDLRNKRWEFIGGCAARNRANGVVVQATTSGTYTAPAINPL